MINLDELMADRKVLSKIGRGELLDIISVLLDERKDLLAALKPKTVDLLGRSAKEIQKVEDYFNGAEKMLSEDYEGLHDQLDGAHTSRSLSEEQLAAIERGDSFEDVRDHDIPDEA